MNRNLLEEAIQELENQNYEFPEREEYSEENVIQTNSSLGGQVSDDPWGVSLAIGNEEGFKVETEDGTELVRVPATDIVPKGRPHIGGREDSWLSDDMYLVGTDEDEKYVQYFKVNSSGEETELVVLPDSDYRHEDGDIFVPRLAVSKEVKNKRIITNGTYWLQNLQEEPLTLKYLEMEGGDAYMDKNEVETEREEF